MRIEIRNNDGEIQFERKGILMTYLCLVDKVGTGSIGLMDEAPLEVHIQGFLRFMPIVVSSVLERYDILLKENPTPENAKLAAFLQSFKESFQQYILHHFGIDIGMPIVEQEKN